MILFKGGGYTILSNLAAYAVEWRGRVWPTVEHAYQAAKFDNKEIVEQIANARSPYDAKRLANEYANEIRDEWHSENVAVMEELLREKVAQHEHVRKTLLESGNEELIENTDDTFWGRGEDGNGENKLGELWMMVRSEL